VTFLAYEPPRCVCPHLPAAFGIWKVGFEVVLPPKSLSSWNSTTDRLPVTYTALQGEEDTG
jgi:hypothetical protein